MDKFMIGRHPLKEVVRKRMRVLPPPLSDLRSIFTAGWSAWTSDKADAERADALTEQFGDLVETPEMRRDGVPA